MDRDLSICIVRPAEAATREGGGFRAEPEAVVLWEECVGPRGGVAPDSSTKGPWVLATREAESARIKRALCECLSVSGAGSRVLWDSYHASQTGERWR